MAGTKWLIPWITPQMLTPITNCQSTGGTSVSLVPCIGTPALLQTMCSLPKLRSVSARAASTDCSCVTSIRSGLHTLIRTGETMSRLLDQISLDVRHDHVRASLCKRGCNAEPDARSGTRDDRGLTGDVVHLRGLLLSSWMGHSLESAGHGGAKMRV